MEHRLDEAKKEIMRLEEKGGEEEAIIELKGMMEKVSKEEKLSWERCMGLAINHKDVKKVRKDFARVEGELKRAERLFSTLVRLDSVLNNDYNRVNKKLVKEMEEVEYLKKYQNQKRND